MKITPKIQLHLKVQNIIFYLLLITAVVILAQLSIKTNVHSDWTANSRHSLSETTIDFLTQLDDDVTIQAFISPNNEYRSTVELLLSRYQGYSEKLKVDYINPDFSPDLVRQLNIQQQAELVISKGERQEHVYDLSEQSLTNAIISVSRKTEQWLIFIEGHGERSPFSQANFGLNTWAEQLKLKGLKLQGLNLVENSQIPHNASAVVIASPEKAWLPGEIDIINNYINHGGNLLWLAEPDSYYHLNGLAEQLGIEFIPGTLIDPNAQLLGINDPRFVLITDYANHPIGAATESVTLFPQAVALEPFDFESPWEHIALLSSQSNTWSDIDTMEQQTTSEFSFDAGADTPGPLSIGYLLTRVITEQDDQQQRIAIIGDGDFLSNTYIGNAGNLNLGIALANWLVQEDELIAIPVKTTIDNQLNLSQAQSLVIGLGFLIVIPLLLLSIGAGLWWQRRKR